MLPSSSFSLVPEQTSRFLSRLADACRAGAIALACLTLCAGCSEQPSSSRPTAHPTTGVGGITREEAQELGVDVAPGDGRIVAVDARGGSDRMRVSVMNVSDDADEYTVVVLSGERELGTGHRLVGAGETADLTIVLESAPSPGEVLDVRLDAALIGTGVAVEDVTVR